MPLLCLIVRVRFSSSLTSLSYVGQLLRQAIPNNQSTQDNIFSLKKQQKSAEKPKMWCGKKKRALCQGEKLVEIQTRKDVGWGLLEKIRTFCVSWLFLCLAQSSSQSPKMSTIIERVQNWLFSVDLFLAGLDLYGQLLLATFFQQVYPRNRKPSHRKRRFSEALRKNWLLCSKSVLESNYWSQLKHKSAKHTHQCTAFHMSKQPGQ